MSPESPLYNVPYSFEIQGNISPDLFAESFRELIDQNDALRAVFEEEDGQISQIFVQDLNYALEFIDKRHDSDEDIQNYLFQQSQSIFTPGKPLFKSVLIQTQDEEFIWFFMLHHLITDAASVHILFNKLSSIYLEKLTGLVSEPVTKALYSEYVNFESAARETEQHKELKKYWQEKLGEPIELPKLYGKSFQSQTTEASRQTFFLGEQRSAALRRLSQQPENRMFTDSMSLVNLFSALFFSYLRQISPQEKLIFGSPVHNRNAPQFKNTAGLFIEVLPMMNDIRADQSFLDLLRENRSVFSEFLHNTDTALASAEISRSFNTVLNYIPWDFQSFADMPVVAHWIHPGHCDPAHIIRAHILDHKSGDLELIFDLNTAYFDAEEAKRIPEHFIAIIDQVLDNPKLRLDEFNISTPEEKEYLMSLALPEIGEDEDWDILDRFRTMADRYSDKIALECGSEEYTYEELKDRVATLAHLLQERGVSEGSQVGIYLHRSPEYIFSVLAILKAGAAFVPIASNLPQERARYILMDSDCNLCITDGSLGNSLDIPEKNIFRIDHQWYGESADSTFENAHENSNGKIAYHLYTSGSTGKPKGVIIPVRGLQNYLNWATAYYGIDENSSFPLFTSTGFDLTISSTFLPLLNGGKLVVYREPQMGPDISLFRVFADNEVNVIKLTPSHLVLLQGRDLSASGITKMIVGGEDFKSTLAKDIQQAIGDDLSIFNEYGPTEATVGCIVAKYDKYRHNKVSVPVGRPITNMRAYVMNNGHQLVPAGVIGELYLSGRSLALGYQNLVEMSKSKFLPDPFNKGEFMYRTGDLARWNNEGELEFLGRIDEQVKLNGYRIELADIESNLTDYPDIENASVVVLGGDQQESEEVTNCTQCGLPSNYPNTDFDEHGVCHLCNSFESYSNKVGSYFKDEAELHRILSSGVGNNSSYDCLALLSGGKDSTYVLAKLVNMGLRVLAFTLDNGYISDQAKENINRIVTKLGVDHVYGETPHMNKIFVDSLKRHQNVCNGCFKVIYTLSTQLALEKKIPFIVTGLSRGQFFETRLSEELFWERASQTKSIDETILEARKLYHLEDDAVRRHMDVRMFESDETFEKVQFVDFYRYNDAPLSEILRYLKEKVGWVRPTDTGRSTNCLINQLGIYVHKKEKGYSNYAFPYSWDVRLGHKTREESLDEINEHIYEDEVKRMMDEIGYIETDDSLKKIDRLVAYYVSKTEIPGAEMRRYLKSKLPDYMIPGIYKRMDSLPLTSNGKVDKRSLQNLNEAQLAMENPYVAPRNEIEELLEAIWAEVMQLKKVGVHDNFIALGGHSLAAIRITTQINEELHLNFPLNVIFDLPTIAEYSTHIENTLVELMEE